MRYLFVVLALFLVSPAYGHEDGSPFADWFRSLKQPDSPSVSCCGPADQYYVDEYRMTDDKGFIVKVNGIWITVPPFKVDWTDVNPTGRGVIFLSGRPESWTNKDFQPVLCFIPGVGT